MSFVQSRANFLRGGLDGRGPIRPPWALDEAQFIDICTRCSDCVRSCPEQIIVKGRGGFPELNFSLGACSFCEQCVQACSVQALTKQQSEPWSITAVIQNQCMAFSGIVCFSCRDACLDSAISFKPQLGGYFIPQINSSSCSGCGACVKPCPEQAIQMKPFTEECS